MLTAEAISSPKSEKTPKKVTSQTSVNAVASNKTYGRTVNGIKGIHGQGSLFQE